MHTVALPPVEDLLVAWHQYPADGLGLWRKISEGYDAQNGDADYIYDTAGADQKFRMAALPDGLHASLAVRLRCVARAADASLILSFIVWVNDAPHILDVASSFDFTALPLNEWVPRSFDITAELPALAGGEHLDVTLRVGSGAGFELRVTALELEIDYAGKSVHSGIVPKGAQL